MNTVDRFRLEKLRGLERYLERADKELDIRQKNILRYMYMQCLLTVSEHKDLEGNFDMDMVYFLVQHMYQDRAELKSILFGDAPVDSW